MGISLGLLFVYLIIGFLNLYFYLWHKWQPLRPICKNGKCKSDDYKWVTSIGDFHPVFICSCGNIYIQNGGCFIELLPDGKSKPYMIHSLFGRWKKDNSIKTGFGTLYPPKFSNETITKIIELSKDVDNPNILITITPTYDKLCEDGTAL